MPTPEWTSGEPEELLPIEAVPDEAALDTAYEPGEPDGTRKRRHIGGFSGLGAIALALACSRGVPPHSHPEHEQLKQQVGVLQTEATARERRLAELEKTLPEVLTANNQLKQDLAVAQRETEEAKENKSLQKTRAVIEQAVNERFGDDISTRAFRDMIIDGILHVVTAAYKNDGPGNLVIKVAGDPENTRSFKFQLLNWALSTGDGKKLPKWANEFADILQKLPSDMQATLSAETRTFIGHYNEAIVVYERYKKILEHHDDWCEAKRKEKTYEDPCGDEKLHQQYQGTDYTSDFGGGVPMGTRFVLLMMHELHERGVPLARITEAVQVLRNRLGL